MAIAQFTYGGTSGSAAGSVYADPKLLVETRASWAGAWTLCPYLEVLNFMLCAAPSIGTAKLRYRWGTIKREDKNAFSSYAFADYRGRFVRIRAAGAGTASLWTGIIDIDQPMPFGSDVPGGQVELTAYELGHLLDRQIVHDAPSLSGQDKVVIVETVPVANERFERGRAQLGNRSSATFKLTSAAATADKVYVFGGTDKWTNQDLAKMLLRRYTPEGVTFMLGGLTAAISGIESVTPIAGRSVWSILQDLIPKNRGLTFCIRPGNTTCTIEIGTVLEKELKVGEFTVPKCASQISLDVTNEITVAALDITRMRSNRYHEFEARGARLLSCFTVGYADGTLEEGWKYGADTLESEYLEAAKDADGYGDLEEWEQAQLNDAAREADRFEEVWQKHRVPKTWDGLVKDGAGGGEAHPALLKCSESGEVTWAKAAVGLNDGKSPDDSSPEVAFAPQGKAFETWLPLEHAQDYTTDPSLVLQPDDAEPVYRKPFVALLYAEGVNCFLDRPHDSVKDAAAHVFVHDREMAIGCSVSPRHLHAGDMFDYEAAGRSGVVAEPSSYDPVVNYETFLATVAMRMDGHLRVVTRSKDAPTTNARRMVVYLSDAEYWGIAAGTVVDVAPDGTLWRSPGAVLRDDSDRLRAACALMSAWYGRDRAALSVTLRQVSVPCLPGQLLVSALSSDGKLDVGTPITSVAVDVVGRSVTVRTDYQELDVSRF